MTIKEFDTIARLEIQAIDAYTKHTTAVEMTHDLEANFNEFAPFSKEAAKELQDHAAKTPDIFVTQSRTQRWLRSKAPSSAL